MTIRVYLAGKIARNDWRIRIFQGISRPAFREWDHLPAFPERGPKSEEFEYCGPYFIECWDGGHRCGCYSREEGHGVGAGSISGHQYEVCGPNGPDQSEVITRCLDWLQSADVLFVWFDNLTAYGTMAEIGYAKSIGIPIWIFKSERLEADAWFVEGLADYRGYADSPEKAWSLFKVQARERLQVLFLCRMPYGEYLQTEHWKEMRKRALAAAEYRCQVCNIGDGLTVHHRTYERRGEELLSDLITLCKSCHSIFHGSGKLATSELPSQTGRKRR
jgi:hypothetical protein